MLKYLVILLDDASVSYCHYQNGNTPRLIPLDTLQKGIMFAMKNDLKIQYVLPKRNLPSEYLEVMESMFHDNIGPLEQNALSDVIVINGLHKLISEEEKITVEKRYIVRTPLQDFLDNYGILKQIFARNISVNLVFNDVEIFSDDMIETYQATLEIIADYILDCVTEGHPVNTNILTDRIALDEMNNCGAGDTSITLAPNGKFYPCPAFYYNQDTFQESGDPDRGLNIKNKKLFSLEGSPLCKRCDAYHCKRCAWLNKKLTCEVNIPSKQQCVMAHIERNASKLLLEKFHESDILIDKDIKEVDYLDPFDKYQSV